MLQKLFRGITFANRDFKRAEEFRSLKRPVRESRCDCNGRSLPGLNAMLSPREHVHNCELCMMFLCKSTRKTQWQFNIGVERNGEGHPTVLVGALRYGWN